MQLGRSDGGQASTVKEVVQKRAFHLLLTAVWAVTDSSLNHLPRAVVSQPDTVQYDSRLARHISRSIETVILCHCTVPGGGRGAMSHPGIVLLESALLHRLEHSRLDLSDTDEDREGD